MTAQDTAPRGRIRRDTTNGMIGGVAAGFARHLDIDVVWIRLAFVLLTVFGGGFGLVAYLAAWLIIPDGRNDEAAPRPRRGDGQPDGRGAPFWTGVVLLTLGGVILIDSVLSPLVDRMLWVSTRDLIVPLVLIGIGALIYRSSRNGDLVIRAGRIEEQAEVLGEHIEREAESLGDRIEQRVERWGEEVERVAEDWETRIELRAETLREARSQARVAPLTFGAAFITLGGLWLASSLGVPGITLTRALAGTLLVIGIGLVVGAFLGRGRGLIVTGAILAPVVALMALFPHIPDSLEVVSIGPDGVIVSDGERRVEAPATLAALPTDGTYEFGAGSFTLDLRTLGDEIAAAGTVRISVEMGIGSLQVRLPDDVTVEVDVELGIGRIRILDASSSGGIGVSDRQRLVLGDGGGTLVLEIEQGIGDVAVTR
jgi:phage shock protein PspC (stress-responsive transcriptional regulator)